MSDIRGSAASNGHDQPYRCRNGCGFFGSEKAKGYCSKCYRDLHGDATPNLDSSSRGTTEASTPSTVATASTSDLLDIQPGNTTAPLAKASGEVQTINTNKRPIDEVESPASIMEKTRARKKQRRCGFQGCRRKLGLLGFECKCGSTFCGEHRYAEAHDCSFDFRQAGRKMIEAENPLVAPDKLTDRI